MEPPSLAAPPTASSAPPGTGAVVPTRRRLRVMASMLVLMLLMAALLAIASNKIQFEKVISGSMEPNLLIGDVVLVDANVFPSRYDIVCLKNPEKPEEILVKRVIGLPGDEIAIRDGTLYIDGRKEVSDHVTTNDLAWRDIRVRVPDDTLFVLGDNRNNSYDSLNYGPVPFANLTGTVKWIVRPLSRLGRPQGLHDNPPAKVQTASSAG